MVCPEFPTATVLQHLARLALAAAMSAAGLAQAQVPTPADAAKPPAVLASTHAATALPAQPPAAPQQEAAAKRTVLEDDQVRIEELKVRGQVQRITVQSKLRGVAPYQILPPSAARDPSVPGQAAGQRVWSFDF